MPGYSFATRDLSRIRQAATRALDKPRTSWGWNKRMNESWNRKKAHLPTYSARELIADRRGLFTSKKTVTAMDLHLAKHMSFERQRGFKWNAAFGWTRRTYNRGVVDFNAAEKDFRQQMRISGLSSLEQANGLRGFRVHKNRMLAQGAKHRHGKLTLSFDQQRQLFRYDGSPSELSWKSIRILDTAKRQSPSSTNSQKLLYDPALDAKAHELVDELGALRKAGLVQRNQFGSYIIEEPRLRYWLKEFDRSGYGLMGCKAWAARAEKRFDGIGTQFDDVWKDGFLYVHLKGSRRQGNSPLQHGLSPSTQGVYLRTARNLEKMPLESRPIYLAARANEVGSQRWWAEHVVLRRQIRYLEEVARDRGQDPLANELFELRRGVESMQYKSIRTQPREPRQAKPHHAPVSEHSIESVRLAAMRKGDVELADAISLHAELGLRPAELQHGVHFERRGSALYAHISGAKKNAGLDSEHKRFAAGKGLDRTVEVDSELMADIARRHGGQFRPVSSKGALAERLRELRKEVPEASHLTAYTLRHNFTDKLREAGESPQEIARKMGHQSTDSQVQYGTR